MSVRRLAPKELQPDAFAFTAENEAWVDKEIAKYPPGRQASAVIPLLWRAQEQAGGWVPQAAIEAVAARLGMARIRVLEVATFYTMFNLEPVGRYFIQMCGTTPCQLRGAGAIRKVLEERIGDQHHVTPDGKFSWLEVECLGACCNAPMVQINYDYYEDLTPESMGKLMDDLAAGRPVKTGSQIGRVTSEPEGGAQTLTDPTLYDGSVVGSWRKRFEEEAAKKAAAAAAPPAPAAPAPAPVAPAPAAPAPVAAAPKPDATPAKAAAAEADSAKVPASPKPDPAIDRAGPVNPPVAAAGGPAETVSDEHKPVLLAAAREGGGDDLKLIWGVGPKLEEMLHQMGVFHFDQIAAWTDMNLRWVDQNLGAFKGRAVRDDWIGQSKKLATGWRPENAAGANPHPHS
ncbi:NADH-quinone oxidoreductase subunit NuoE [Labrys wisconsinensis]|uniref:NADH-quinone oxidoreductase subunit E n=1 Tax=Labrys wisconsinensis TaxID=425677 RepID=A0ABU0J6I9_9HYPH|nr:NADH-quinone oxidoreductase subunit NuoE [Labrys wisconsinensis]MDQ0468899.1 NADH-quinone oxidoreductase subunit E [Labrys wisconsinensis]